MEQGKAQVKNEWTQILLQERATRGHLQWIQNNFHQLRLSKEEGSKLLLLPLIEPFMEAPYPKGSKDSYLKAFGAKDHTT